ncbi:hypothetical protein [Lacunimicrobium album]
MVPVVITKETFLQHPQGKTFADVLEDSPKLFDVVLRFFNEPKRQQRMEDSEIHHDRAPMAGVVREFESLPHVNKFLTAVHPKRSMRFRQSVGVLVRIIMEGRGWSKTGRKGSLGVRAESRANTPTHNSGGLAFWFVRAERYQCPQKLAFASVKTRSEQLKTTPAAAKPTSKSKSKTK